jgi:phage-related protein
MKQIRWLGSSYEKLRKFPKEAMREAGRQLNQLQQGREPDDWKPMSSIGLGVMEIRIHRPHEHRVIYIAKFAQAVYVQHVFGKKTQKTAGRDLKIARAAYAKIKRMQEEIH